MKNLGGDSSWNWWIDRGFYGTTYIVINHFFKVERYDFIIHRASFTLPFDNRSKLTLLKAKHNYEEFKTNSP